MFDIAVVGGTVIDGTGAAPGRADVGIREGRVVSIGVLDEPALETVDATDLIVAPGFIDVHTHYDAQVLWDSGLGNSTRYGITTVLGGNCGFTLAPLHDQDRDYMVQMLAKVEGMPLAALRSALPTDWTTIAEYLDRVEGNLGPNAGFLIGHSAIRRAVMHDDATERAATAEELAAMKDLLDEGLAAGGMGFSSTWSPTHVDHCGRPVPSRAAPREELVALCEVVAQHPGTTVEFIAGVGTFTDDEVETMAAMSVAAQRPLNWNMLQVFADNRSVQDSQLLASDFAAAQGGRVVALTLPSNGTLRLGFEESPIYDAVRGLDHFMGLSEAERLSILSDREARTKLGAEIEAGPARFKMYVDWRTLRVETFAAATSQFNGLTVGEVADTLNREPWDVVCDLMIADELRTGLHLLDRDGDIETWERRRDVWRDPRTLIGASDAGAHLDMISSYAYTAWLLEFGVRRHQLIPLEEAIKMLTDDPAQLMGLRDRGRIAEGYWADIVVLDPDTVSAGAPTMVFDMPAGAGRVHCEPRGIETVIVNGTVLVQGGVVGDARPGQLLRSGRDSVTVRP
jgi:N-acyl-D-aspartate/D-glutamate deacylase